VTRWLLNTFPTWALAVILVGGFVLLAVGGLWLVRRIAPEARRAEANDFAGVMAGVIAAVYGVFLAFAIVALYDEFHEADAAVRTEAAALTRVASNAAGLPPLEAERMRSAVLTYRDTVVTAEWRAMEEGRASEDAWDALERLYGVLHRFEPRSEREAALYDASVGAVNELVDARRSRLHGAEATLPSTVMLLLFGGGVLTLGFTLVFGVPRPELQTGMAVSLAVLLGFSLLVALLLDHPFSGGVAISAAPFGEDALRDL
jgi:hypothetical protein